VTIGPILRLAVGLLIVYTTLPTVIVVAASFGGGSQITFPPNSVSLDSYVAMFEDPNFVRALQNSLYVAAVAAVVNVIAVVPAALALGRYKIRGRTLLSAYLSLGVMAPFIVSAIAFLVLFSILGVLSHLTVVALGIAIVNFPFMLWAVGTTVADMNPELEKAAATLGAEEIQTFLFVTLPMMAPGILTGALLVFMFALGDFVISIVLVNLNNLTLPVLVYSGLRFAVSPKLAAASALLIGIAVVIFAVVLRLGKIEQFLYRR